MAATAYKLTLGLGDDDYESTTLSFRSDFDACLGASALAALVHGYVVGVYQEGSSQELFHGQQVAS